MRQQHYVLSNDIHIKNTPYSYKTHNDTRTEFPNNFRNPLGASSMGVTAVTELDGRVSRQDFPSSAARRLFVL